MDYSSLNRSELLRLCKEKQIKGYSGKRKEELISFISQYPSASNSIHTDIHTPNKSPLRYPGGKTRAIHILERYVRQYYPSQRVLLSPFFGGGSFELYMCQHQRDYTVLANDLFQPLYTFWSTLQNHRDRLLEKIEENMPLTKDRFKEMRTAILNGPIVMNDPLGTFVSQDMNDPIEQAAYYFCLNRSSFSGATLSGGFSHQAAETRLTASSLNTLRQCNVENIVFSQLDCCEFLRNHPQTSDTIVYADPPYYIDSFIYGKNGDLHQAFDHAKFAEVILQRTDWVISYNDCEYIRELYKDCRIYSENWSYGMNTTKKSSEIIILPPEHPRLAS